MGFRTSRAEGYEWIRKTVRFDSSMSEMEQRRAASLELARLEIEYADKKKKPDATITVADFAEIWFRNHVDVELRPTTAAQYHHLMEGRILQLIGAVRLDELRPMDVVGMMTALRSMDAMTTAIEPDKRKNRHDRLKPSAPPKKLSDRTLRHYYDTLNYMLNKAVQWDYLKENPLDKVDRPKLRKHRREFLTDEDAVRLLRHLASEPNMAFRVAVMLALVCGLRLGEVGGLKWSDVNLNDRSVTIRRAAHYTAGAGDYLGDPKTDAAERIVWLPAGMIAMLQSLQDEQNETAAQLGSRWRGEGIIVCNYDGRPYHYDTPSKLFKKFAEAHGFPDIHFHDLRHAHASILLANNVDAVAVAARIGHASADTTLRIYAHAIRKRDEASVSAMDALLGDVTGEQSGEPVPNPRNQPAD